MLASSFSISFTRDCAWLERLALAPKRATNSLSSAMRFFFCAMSASPWRLPVVFCSTKEV